MRPRPNLPRRPKTPRNDAWRYLTALLSYRPRTEAEARQRLQQRGISFDEIERLIGEARQAGMIDDRLFAKLWVEDRMLHRPLARRAVSQELRRKGVDAPLVEQALQDGYPVSREPEVALRLARMRFERLQTVADPEKRTRRVLGFLDRRGFSRDLALRVVRQVEQEEDRGE